MSSRQRSSTDQARLEDARRRLTHRIDPTGAIWNAVKHLVARYADRKPRERSQP